MSQRYTSIYCRAPRQVFFKLHQALDLGSRRGMRKCDLINDLLDHPDLDKLIEQENKVLATYMNTREYQVKRNYKCILKHGIP